MLKKGFYSSGEFAKKANVTVRTIRYYDKQDILKPSYVTHKGARFYTDSDFARLQQVLLLKYLGFSLDDIKNITIDDSDYSILLNSLHLQLKLIQDKIEQMQLVKNAIEETTAAIEAEKSIDWSSMLTLIHLTNMENSKRTQYMNAGNISARINLHAMYSVNKKGWFCWLYEQCDVKPGMKILELGCGDGRFWVDNAENVKKILSMTDNNKEYMEINITDISEGMVNDARRNINQSYKQTCENTGEFCKKSNKDCVKCDSQMTTFNYGVVDCQRIPYKDNSYDIVIANHVLFYCNNINNALKEIKRVLKPGGKFICSTYGSHHMQEISKLVSEFDKRIVLSAEKLYDIFGLDRGKEQLLPYFQNVKVSMYKDYLLVDKAEPLIEYILSCHGNQNQYLLNRYSDFKLFLGKKLVKPMRITKEAGVFICET